MKLEKIEKPFNLIIFGASGDLAQLKLFPAIYELALQKRLKKDFKIFGYARTKMSQEQFRRHFAKSVREHADKLTFSQQILDELLDHLEYVDGQYDHEEDFKNLAEKLLAAHKGAKVYNLAFFAVPPLAFKPIVKNLAVIKSKIGNKLELMLEKPFGDDRKSAGELFQFITNHFKKENLFLIDHYLGKPAVRSIFPLRYNNAILNLLLKGHAISNIQISAMEKAGVDERVGYFDNVGIIKDMVQSHLLQILALLTMAMPVHKEVHSIRREKGDVISSLRQDKKGGIVLGQYKSYKTQKEVQKGSKTPTFAALRLFIDLTEWYEVPIYIRSGKQLSHKHTYIVVEFKKPAYAKTEKVEANRLIIELYPKERIQIRLVNDLGKLVPEYSSLITEESLACMGDDCLPEYANMILDACLGRYVSFLSIDEILASWHFIDQIHARIKKEGIKTISYTEGSEGPAKQNELTRMDKNEWYDAKHL
ncbi:MAG: glucose-6-phosphate dehydrogenase (NADP(+)) [Candidatus Peregrinibacteria bacterium]|nr:glucose-6-phosphate dehydrogenase (NADP(+)) [Candidatus Peregrinibacteria bacterium]